MSELGKPFLKNQKKKNKKKTENQFQNAARENKKPLEICNFDSNKKLGPEWAVNGLGKLVRKKSYPKN